MAPHMINNEIAVAREKLAKLRERYNQQAKPLRKELNRLLQAHHRLTGTKKSPDIDYNNLTTGDMLAVADIHMRDQDQFANMLEAITSSLAELGSDSGATPQREDDLIHKVESEAVLQSDDATAISDGQDEEAFDAGPDDEIITTEP